MISVCFERTATVSEFCTILRLCIYWTTVTMKKTGIKFWAQEWGFEVTEWRGFSNISLVIQSTPYSRQEPTKYEPNFMFYWVKKGKYTIVLSNYFELHSLVCIFHINIYLLCKSTYCASILLWTCRWQSVFNAGIIFFRFLYFSKL